MNTIRSHFEGRRGRGSVEERWTELKKGIVDTAEQHQRRQPQKGWMSVDTLKLTQKKRLAFVSWQNQRTSVERRKEYATLCKEVRKAVRNDKEKWWNGEMAMLEEDLRRIRRRFFQEVEETEWQQNKTSRHHPGCRPTTATEGRQAGSLEEAL